jgi:hypothetical protein
MYDRGYWSVRLDLLNYRASGEGRCRWPGGKAVEAHEASQGLNPDAHYVSIKWRQQQQ